MMGDGQEGKSIAKQEIDIKLTVAVAGVREEYIALVDCNSCYLYKGSLPQGSLYSCTSAIAPAISYLKP
jgi:hypothetical protein